MGVVEKDIKREGALKFLAKAFGITVLLIIAGYFVSNYLLSDPHSISLTRIIIAAVLYILIGYAVGRNLPHVWWMAIMADWGLGLYSFIGLAYSLTHLFADIDQIIFAPILIVLTLLASWFAARQQLSTA